MRKGGAKGDGGGHQTSHAWSTPCLPGTRLRGRGVAGDGEAWPGTGPSARSGSAGLVLTGVLAVDGSPVLHVALCPHVPFLTPGPQHNTPVCSDVPFMDPFVATGLNNTDKQPGTKLRARNAVRSFLNTIALRPPNSAEMTSPRSADKGLKESEDGGQRSLLFVSVFMPERVSCTSQSPAKLTGSLSCPPGASAAIELQQPEHWVSRASAPAR